MNTFSGKKILFVSHLANFQKFNQPLMKMAEREGAIVDYASDGSEVIEGVRRDIKINFVRQPWKLWQHFRALREIRELLKTEKYDIIHTHTATASAIVRLANRTTKNRNHVPLIYTAHHFQFCRQGPISNWIWLPIESILGNFYTDVLVTISNGDFRTARKYMSRTRNVRISGVGVDTVKFRPSMAADEREKYRREYFGAEAEDYVIGYVAEMINRKNHLFLLKALQRALRGSGDTGSAKAGKASPTEGVGRPRLKLVLVGKGKNRGKIEDFIQKNDLSKNVRIITEKLPRIEQFYESLDLEISTSWREGLGMHLLEALAVGTPVLASNIEGHNKFLKDEQMYELKNPEKLAMELDFLYQVWYNESLGKTRKPRKSLMPDKYTLEHSLDEIRKVYEECLRLSKKRD